MVPFNDYLPLYCNSGIDEKILVTFDWESLFYLTLRSLIFSVLSLSISFYNKRGTYNTRLTLGQCSPQINSAETWLCKLGRRPIHKTHILSNATREPVNSHAAMYLPLRCSFHKIGRRLTQQRSTAKTHFYSQIHDHTVLNYPEDYQLTSLST